MNTMKKKIAIINSKTDKRTVLAIALSNASHYQFLQNRNVYEWQRKFQIDDHQVYDFQNQFLILSSSFVKRIKSEFENESFISCGAAFSEIISLKSKLNCSSIDFYQPKEQTMIESLLNVSGRYAADHYDLVIHVQNPDSTGFDEYSDEFYRNHNIAYKTYQDDDLKNTLEDIFQQTEIPKTLSAESAIFEAEQLFNFKNWKS